MQVVYLGGDPSRQGCSVGRLKGGGCFIERLHEVGVAAPSTEKAYRILLLEGCPRIVPVCGLCCLSRLQEKPHNGRAERCCSTAEKGCGLCTCTDPPQPGQNQGVKGPGPGSRASVKMVRYVLVLTQTQDQISVVPCAISAVLGSFFTLENLSFPICKMELITLLLSWVDVGSQREYSEGCIPTCKRIKLHPYLTPCAKFYSK